MNDSYEETADSIRSLPPPPSEDPGAETLNLVNQFTKNMASYIAGSHRYKKLIQDVNAVYKQFKMEIRGTTPRYTPFTKMEQQHAPSKSKGDDFMDLLHDPVNSISQPTSAAKANLVAQLTGLLHRKINEEPAGASHDLIDMASAMDEWGRSALCAHIRLVILISAVTRELPSNVPFDVKLGLIEEAIKQWTKVVFSPFDVIKPVVDTLVLEQVKIVFGPFSRTFYQPGYREFGRM